MLVICEYSGKSQYSQSEAAKALRALKKKNSSGKTSKARNRKEATYYRCHHCEKFHLTTQRRRTGKG